MIHGKILFLFSLLFLCSFKYAGSQDRPYFEYDLFETSNESGNNAFSLNDKIFFISSAVCNSTLKQCFTIFCLDNKYKFLWSKEFNWIDKGNKDILGAKGDTLFVSSHGDFNTEYHLLGLSLNGDSILHFQYDLSNSFISGLSNDGIALGESEILIFGSGTNINQENVGFIQSIDYGGNVLKRKTINEPESEWNHISELKYNSGTKKYYGILSSSKLGPRVNKKSIVAVNSDLNIDIVYDLKSHNGLFDVGNNLAILDNGDIVFFDVIDNLTSSYPEKLVCIDTEGSYKWQLNWPDIQFGFEFIDYNISNIKSKGNDVIGCGTFQRYVEFLNKWVNEGYIFKVSKNGILIWERFYTYSSSYDFFEKEISFSDIEEFNGKLNVIGNIYDVNDNKYKTLHVITNENGCTYSSNCEDLQSNLSLSSSSAAIKEEKILIYPNPIIRYMNVNVLENPPYLIHIYNLKGALIKRMKNVNFLKSIQIDLNDLSTGLYLVKCLADDGKNIHSELIIKQN